MSGFCCLDCLCGKRKAFFRRCVSKAHRIECKEEAILHVADSCIHHCYICIVGFAVVNELCAGADPCTVCHSKQNCSALDYSKVRQNDTDDFAVFDFTFLKFAGHEFKQMHA